MQEPAQKELKQAESGTAHVQVSAAGGSDGAQFYGVVFDGLNALGSLVIACLALFGDRIRGWLVRPRIRIECGTGGPFVEQTTETNSSDEAIEKLVVRLRLTNTGRSSAKYCRVLVHDIYKKRGDGSVYIKSDLLPTDIIWPTERPQDILRDVPYYLNLAEVREDERVGTVDAQGNGKSGRACLYICVESAGVKGAFHRIGKGTVIVPIRVYAENLKKSKLEYIEVYWSGSDIGSKSQSNFGCRIINEQEFKRLIGEGT